MHINRKTHVYAQNVVIRKQQQTEEQKKCNQHRSHKRAAFQWASRDITANVRKCCLYTRMIKHTKTVSSFNINGSGFLFVCHYFNFWYYMATDIILDWFWLQYVNITTIDSINLFWTTREREREQKKKKKK